LSDEKLSNTKKVMINLVKNYEKENHYLPNKDNSEEEEVDLDFKALKSITSNNKKIKKKDININQSKNLKRFNNNSDKNTNN